MDQKCKSLNSVTQVQILTLPCSCLTLGRAPHLLGLPSSRLEVGHTFAPSASLMGSDEATSGQVSMWSTPVANILYYGLHRPLDCVRNSSRWHSKEFPLRFRRDLKKSSFRCGGSLPFATCGRHSSISWPHPFNSARGQRGSGEGTDPWPSSPR